MKIFQIEIKEELSRIIFIEAKTPDEALDKAKSLYKAEEIVLDSDDFIGEPEISLLPKAKKILN